MKQMLFQELELSQEETQYGLWKLACVFNTLIHKLELLRHRSIKECLVSSYEEHINVENTCMGQDLL